MTEHRRLRQPLPLTVPLCASLLALVWALGLPARGEAADEIPTPKAFSDFKEAVAHAQQRNLHIFIACLKTGDADSEKLAGILESTNLYLHGDKAVLFQYRVDDDARGESFRSHFGVEESSYPIVILTSPEGKPLGYKSGLLTEYDYYAFIEETAGYAALSLPITVRLKRNLTAVMKDAASGKGKYHTPMRVWTLVTGEKFEGAVLHSTGLQVSFETKSGELREVAALELSRPDFDFIKRALESEKTFP